MSDFVPMAAIGIGAYLLWFGVHYWRDQTSTYPHTVIKSVVSGGGLPSPSTEPSRAAAAKAQLNSDQNSAVADSASGAAGSASTGAPVAGSGTGAAAAQDALTYVGHVYVYGGPANPAGGWDCSSFMNYVLGHDEGLSLPGGSYASVTSNGTAHGPVVSDYTSYGTAVSTSSIQAGDLLLWSPEHMGMATSATEMVSAETPAAGTGTSTISGMSQSLSGYSLTVRRPAYSTASTAPAVSTGTAPDVTGNYTTAQLEALWTSQGGSASSASLAAAHAMFESSGRPAVTSANPDGGTNVGLWQLDTKGVGAGYSVAQLSVPATNAKLTVAATKNGTDWSEWSPIT